MLSLEVPNEELINRLLERGKSSGRSDDNEEVIRFRLQEYETKTSPVKGYYQERNLYFPINGVGPIRRSLHDSMKPSSIRSKKNGLTWCCRASRFRKRHTGQHAGTEIQPLLHFHRFSPSERSKSRYEIGGK
jgi:hypothetical protein